MREAHEEVKREEDELALKIHHELAGNDDEVAPVLNSSTSAKDIV